LGNEKLLSCTLGEILVISIATKEEPTITITAFILKGIFHLEALRLLVFLRTKGCL